MGTGHPATLSNDRATVAAESACAAVAARQTDAHRHHPGHRATPAAGARPWPPRGRDVDGRPADSRAARDLVARRTQPGVCHGQSVRSTGALAAGPRRRPSPAGCHRVRAARPRCHLCGRLSSATPPDGVGEEKYDATASSMIGLLKCSGEMPFNRVAAMHAGLEIPYRRPRSERASRRPPHACDRSMTS